MTKTCVRLCLGLSVVKFFMTLVSMRFVINTKMYDLHHKMYGALVLLSAFR